MSHSIVGGSAMPRFENCAGSPQFSQYYPNLSNYQAEEGTAAHLLFETAYLDKQSPWYYEGMTMNDVEVTEEMVKHIENFNTVARGIGLFADYEAVELSHTYSDSEYIRGTIDHLAITQHVTTVTDLKYGRVPVPVTTSQLKYYAVLARDRFGATPFYDLGIYQPRLYDGQPFKQMRMTDQQLVQWRDTTMIPAINLALSPNPPRVAGEWCRFCRAKLDCPELKANVQYLQPPFNTTDDGLRALLKFDKTLVNLLEDAKEEALFRLMNGQKLEGYKPVQPRGRTKIIDERGFVEAAVMAGIKEEDLYERKLRGVTELREINKELVEQYGVRGLAKMTVAPLDSSLPAISPYTDRFKK